MKPASRVAALLLLCATSLVAADDRNLRIVNGSPAGPGAYPFFAISGEGSFIFNEARCGASLIHPDILLSAAHCQGAFNYEVLLYNNADQSYSREVTIDQQRRFLDYYTVVGSLNYDIMVGF